MTERVLPAVAVPAPLIRRGGPGIPHRPTGTSLPQRRSGHGADERGSVPTAGAKAGVRPVSARRGQAWLTTPARAGMLLGASAAVYAVSLAGMSLLQASSDADLAASRQPYMDAVARARAANDRLEAAITKADADARALVAAYAAAGDDVAAYEARLDKLASLVADVQGSAAALPTRISLPKVTVRAISTSRASSSAPRTTTKTTASGH